LNLINENIIFQSKIYFIIDSCFSKKFIKDYKFNKILKISYIVSCKGSQYSKEIVTEYEPDLFTFQNIIYKPKIIVGIFTLYFVKLITAREITNINNFKNIINDKLLKIISIKYKQTIYFCEFSNIL
jgi:hypothetical protein